jgi:hypothetical protein
MQVFNITNIINLKQTLKITDENKLLSKIKENFTEEEQKLYITSFYSYINYDEYKDFVISLDDIWNWLDFSQKIRAKELLLKHFTKDINYKIISNNNLDLKKDGRGGHNKETIVLNVNTFKLYCLLAGTEKAKNIHKYYIKLESILHQIIKEESEEFKNQIQLQINQIKHLEQEKNKLSKEKELEKHNILLREFGSAGSLVYIVKVKTNENKNYVVKIGESRKGIDDRYDEHKISYDECVILDCFLVKRSKDFESFIHNHELIKPNRKTDLKGHENEKELFLIGEGLTYDILLNVIKKNIKQFDDYNQEIEIDKLKMEKEVSTIQSNNIKALLELNLSNGNFISELMNSNKLLLNKIESLEKKIDTQTEKINLLQNKNTTNFNEPLKTLGPRLQQINPETLNLVKVFDSISESIKSNPKLKRSSITKAVKENTIYQGFRWYLVDRELDANVLHNIQPTKITKIQNTGYIAKLNKDKTEILNVYLDRKVASLSNGYQYHSALDNPVKNFSLANGFYYCLYDSCSEELKKKFIEKNKSEPILYKNGVGQYDLTNKLVKEFVSKFDCERTLRISDRTMNKTLDKNISYNNFYYKRLPEKVKCFD